MKLKSKLIYIILFVCILRALYVFYILEPQTTGVDDPLPNKSSLNLFDHAALYIMHSTNAITTREVISTGMYAGGNYENFYMIIELPPDDYYVKQAWQQGQASIAFESRLQKTTEWVNNNKYKISMYYYADENNKHPVIFFEGVWVGLDKKTSGVQLLPEASKGKAVYVRYESVLQSILFFTNGNDVRFLDNYLTIQ